MADRFAVAKENLSDTHVVDDLRAVDAALIEPLACVCKSVRGGGTGKTAVIGLGVMGLMHMLLLDGATGLDLSESRRKWAAGLGLDARSPEQAENGAYDAVFVCPGSQAAFDTGLRLAAPGATITMFAPLGPGKDLKVPQAAYFNDLTIRNAYSAAPHDSREAIEALREGKVKAEQVCSEFISLEELPEAYGRMKRGEILKPMVVWP
jgi:threonine dehydrogenase-like Zn-dependent dehydrogenase